MSENKRLMATNAHSEGHMHTAPACKRSLVALVRCTAPCMLGCLHAVYTEVWCQGTSCASAATAALETLQQLVKEQNAALGKLKVQAQEQAANARRLQERYDTADRFAQMLRCAARSSTC
jgi:hypothetical protein